MDVLDKLKLMINQQFNIDMNNIDEATTFEDLGLDSLVFLEFIMAIEEEYDVNISDEVAAGFKRVGQIADYLNNIL